MKGYNSQPILGSPALDIVDDLGHALSHRAISLGSLRLLQGIYQRRGATLH